MLDPQQPALPKWKSHELKTHMVDWRHGVPIYGEHSTFCGIPLHRVGLDFYKAVQDGWLNLKVPTSTRPEDLTCSKCKRMLKRGRFSD